MLSSRISRSSRWSNPVRLMAVGVLVGLGLSLWPSTSAQIAPPFSQRRFYLTPTEHDGAHALAACSADFHMASLWEIFDPSNLVYDTTLGFRRDDSGEAGNAARGITAIMAGCLDVLSRFRKMSAKPNHPLHILMAR